MMTKCPSKRPTLLTRSGREGSNVNQMSLKRTNFCNRSSYEGSNDNQMSFKETKFVKLKWLRKGQMQGRGALGGTGAAEAGAVLRGVFRMKLKSTKELTWKLYTETVQTSINSLL